MKVLLIGSGGREHALAWKMSQSPLLTQMYIAPGNAGTTSLGENVSLDVADHHAVKSFCLQKGIEMVIVGPEAPLVAGLSDYLAGQPETAHLPVIGPKQAGATLEGSKDFSKQFMEKHRIPTARAQTFDAQEIDAAKAYLQSMNAPFVLKADGLAAGKGVIIAKTLLEAETGIEEMLGGKFGEASAKVLIEEFMDGIEFSVFALVDGTDYVILPHAKDYKRIGDGDQGLNTGGMGAISPVPFVDDALMRTVEEKVVIPTVSGLKADGIAYRGFIYFGLMKLGAEVKVVEYNVRLGDPETQVVLPNLKSDLLQLFLLAGEGRLSEANVLFEDHYSSTVVMASGGYPEAYQKGKQIQGLDQVSDAIVFHAGTAHEGDATITTGGRVLAVTGTADTLREAMDRAYQGVGMISFDQAYHRKDIGQNVV